MCLVAVFAAVWVFAGETGCPEDRWDGSPAIARVEGDCLYLLQFNTYLRDLSLGLGLSDPAAEADESGLGEFFTGRRRLVSEFGLDNAAFATLAKDLALYQAASSEGHSSRDAEIMAAMGANRERVRSLQVLLELHYLAKESDLEAFRNLIESPHVRQLFPVQGEEHLLALYQQAAGIDLSGAARGMEIHQGLIESVGDDTYWNEVFFEQARRLLAVESFRVAVGGMASGQSVALRWQDFTEKIWDSAVIELTDAAPDTITLSDVGHYMAGLHALERDLLAK